MKKQLIISLKMLGLMTVLLGVIYPLFITGIAQLAFSEKANGSLVDVNGTLRGSELIGQQNSMPVYFHPRPSATGYNTLPSGGSNLGLTSWELYDAVQQRKLGFTGENNLFSGKVQFPSEMLFASASGLDPHISPQAAKMQIDRIVKARGFSDGQKQQLSALVEKLTEDPQFGVLGCERINVFKLNLELDKLR